MKLKHLSTRGKNNRRYLWIEHKEGYWWVEEASKWYKELPKTYDVASNCKSCKTVKAFRRYLRKNPELQGKLVLVSRFFGYDVEG